MRAWALISPAVLISRVSWVVLVVVLASSLAHAQPAAPDGSSETDAATKAVARELGFEGIQAYKNGDYETALDRLSRAHELVGLTTTGLWRARCLVKLGRLVEGSEALFAVTRLPLPADAKPVHVDAQRQAADERKQLQPRIPRLVIKVVGEVPDDTVVMLDGHIVPPALVGVKQPVDPGEHVLEARGAGISAEKTIELAEGQVLEVPIRLVDRDEGNKKGAPGRHVADEGSPVLAGLGWVAIGLGAAGLIVGGVTGGLALSKKSSLDSGCPARSCPVELHADVDEFGTLRLVSTIAFIAGGVVAATGVTLVITDAVTSDTQTAVTLSPRGLHFEARF